MAEKKPLRVRCKLYGSLDESSDMSEESFPRYPTSVRGKSEQRRKETEKMCDLTRCPVCLEGYEKWFPNVPRLLPCSHTICEDCIMYKGRGSSLDCPECSVTHTSPRCAFPVNQYILKYIEDKKKWSEEIEREKSKIKFSQLKEKFTSYRQGRQFNRPVRQEFKKFSEKLNFKFEDCDDHKRESFMYCCDCKDAVCAVCLLENHKPHNVVDRKKHREEKSEEVVSNVETAIKNLQDLKEKLNNTLEDLDQKSKACDEEITKMKMREVKSVSQSFDELMNENEKLWIKTCHEFDDETKEIDSKIKELKGILVNTNKDTSIRELDSKIKKFDEMKTKLGPLFSKRRSFQYFTYRRPKATVGGLKMADGYLEAQELVVGAEGSEKKKSAEFNRCD